MMKFEWHYTDSKCWFWHKWKVVKDTGETQYIKCEKCKSKKIESKEGGYQPIDFEFLKEEK